MTLEESLATTFAGNPTLGAALAQLAATNEQIAQALANYRPIIEATGQASIEWQNTEANQIGDQAVTENPVSLGIDITQPIYRGGRTAADVERAENTILATRAFVIATEQDVLSDTVVAYMNVVRDQALIELAINNETVLARQLRAARDRFAVGDTTLTDVSQAESRVAGARADRLAAEGALRASRAEFARVVGVPAENLEQPGPVSNLPISLEETIMLAQSNNPNVISAEYTERAAQATIDLVRGEGLPQVNLIGSLSTIFNPSELIDRRDDASLTAQVRVPLYQGGAVSSRVREARETANQRLIEIEETRRLAIAEGIRAWEALMTARTRLESLRAQIRAAQIALEGVRQEALVGARTVLDVLDAEQELLDAQVDRVIAERDLVVAGYDVLAATGRLTAVDLGIAFVRYDFERDYQATRRRWR